MVLIKRSSLKLSIQMPCTVSSLEKRNACAFFHLVINSTEIIATAPNRCDFGFDKLHSESAVGSRTGLKSVPWMNLLSHCSTSTTTSLDQWLKMLNQFMLHLHTYSFSSKTCAFRDILDMRESKSLF